LCESGSDKLLGKSSAGLTHLKDLVNSGPDAAASQAEFNCGAFYTAAKFTLKGIGNYLVNFLDINWGIG